MLATSGRPPGDLTAWAVEPKLDGWRATVTVDEHGSLAVRTRTGRGLTECLPELAPLAGSRPLILDGELIIGAGRLDDFYGLSGRLSGRPHARSARVVFVAFDLLWLDGITLTCQPYAERRAVLESLDLGPVRVVPSYAGEDTDDLLGACENEGMEGVVVKRLSSLYRPGQRTREWAKVKCPAWSEHVVRRRPRSEAS